jgi:hypothetical protein
MTGANASSFVGRRFEGNRVLLAESASAESVQSS